MSLPSWIRGVFSRKASDSKRGRLYRPRLESLEDRLTPSNAPVTIDSTVTALEDTAYTFQLADFNFSDPNDSPANNFAAVNVLSVPAHGNLTLNGQMLISVPGGTTISTADIDAALFKFTAPANANGSAYTSFDFAVQDDGGTPDTSTTETMTIDVTPVNDAPSFSGSNVEADEDDGTVTVTSWATFDPGNEDESGQSATYLVMNISNPSIFELWPSVNSSGALTFILAADRNGSSTFDIQVQDNGGTANGGIDISGVLTFTVTVIAGNDAPDFTALDPDFVDMNAGEVSVPNWTTFTPGSGLDEASQTATYSVTNVSNSSLFDVAPAVSADGTLTYTVAADVAGTSTFEVTVQDNGGTSNNGENTSQTKEFTISVESGQGTPPATITDNLQRPGDSVIPAKITTLGLPGGSKQLAIRIGNQAATASISRTVGEAGSAFFDAARTQTQANLAANQSFLVTIYGGDASSTARNMRLTITVGQNAVATWNFTVFYVIPEPLTTGNINDALPEAVTSGAGALRTLMAGNSGTRGHQQMGNQFFDDTDNSPIAYGAVVIRGKMSPTGIPLADFKTGDRNDSFNWDRRMSGRAYLNNNLMPDPQVTSEGRSDDGNDNDEDLTAGCDLGGTDNVYIWVMDVPFLAPAAVGNDGDVVRARWNFTEIAYYGGTQVSQATPWNWRASVTNPVGNQTFRQSTTYNGDNTLGVNESNSMTIDLAASTIPNFTLTGFNPGAQESLQQNINFTIQGTLLNSGTAANTQAYLIRETSTPTGTNRFTIPLTIANRAANQITGTFNTPVWSGGQGAADNQGLYSLVVFIDGKAVILPNVFRLFR